MASHLELNIAECILCYVKFRENAKLKCRKISILQNRQKDAAKI